MVQGAGSCCCSSWDISGFRGWKSFDQRFRWCRFQRDAKFLIEAFDKTSPPRSVKFHQFKSSQVTVKLTVTIELSLKNNCFKFSRLSNATLINSLLLNEITSSFFDSKNVFASKVLISLNDALKILSLEKNFMSSFFKPLMRFSLTLSTSMFFLENQLDFKAVVSVLQMSRDFNDS